MKEPSIAPAYTFLYPRLCEAARACGYALAIHGTMQRDLDLIAVPWVDEATPARELVMKIVSACDGYVLERREQRDPAPKPHGRLCWSIHMEGGIYIDLSVMPLAKAGDARRSE